MTEREIIMEEMMMIRNNNNNNNGDQEEEEEVIGDQDYVLLPGFRFHPTDEELVGFYLDRKIHHRPLSIELIRQLDIYKFDPWDLPKMAMTGEKEWYFYCQRDRKYRNSARPNRVTGAGFWKATGTDRPIYSSSTNNNGISSSSSSSKSSIIIGLKKSLVFYRGRASKGIKTDWMMHEFRLPDSPNIISPHESWAICRIFKKTNISAAQRAVSFSSNSLLTKHETTPIHKTNHNNIDQNGLVLLPSKTSTDHNYNNSIPFSTNNFPHNFPKSLSYNNDPFDYYLDEGKLPQLSIIPNGPFDHPDPTFTFQPLEVSDIAKSAMDVSSILFNMSSSLLGDFVGSSPPPPPPAETTDPFFTSFQSQLHDRMQAYDNQENNASLLECSKPWESVSPASTSASTSIGYPLSCIWDNLLN